MKYICDYCGKEFLVKKSKVDKRLSGESKYLCCSAKCARDIQKPAWSNIVNLFEQYDYELLSTEYVSSKTKLAYICNKHRDNGIQYVTYNNLNFGYGCKFCGSNRTAAARRLTIEQVKDIFAKNDMILIDGQEYNNTSQKLAYICKHHQEYGIQYMTTSNAYRNRCPHCNVYKGELKISDYLLKNKVKFESQKRYPELVGVGHKPLSYDFYLPDENLLIEYQGEFHDGTSRLLVNEDFEKQKEHDKRKREYAKQHNIKLLEIWYFDFARIETILKEALASKT